ncbi:MAG: LysR family transcriptional regulator [Myxococcota bacterium]
MERLKRLAQFWRWLPAFRVVAETEHLREASKILGISPSALSRTIHLMEDSVGVELFHREGRGIQLTRAGQVMLESVRAAMRVVDDGVSQATSRMFSGVLRVSSYTQWTREVSVAMLSLQNDHPELSPYLYSYDVEEINPKLLRGELDVAFVDNPIPADNLSVIELLRIPNGIYCAQGHPLYGRSDTLELSEVVEHTFIAPVPDSRGHAPDRWPHGVERTVQMHVGDLNTVLEICLQGNLLAALPENIARNATTSHELRRLPIDVLEPVSMFAVRRQQLVEEDLTQHMIGMVRGAVQEQLSAQA